MVWKAVYVSVCVLSQLVSNTEV